jgi:hypothetical protein
MKMMRSHAMKMKMTMNTRLLRMVTGNAGDHDRDLVPDRVQILQVMMMN